MDFQSDNPLVQAARGYDEVLVPALMREWASRTAAAVQVSTGDVVLDVACGTGVVTQDLIGRGAAVTGIDAHPGMLAVARENVPAARFLEASADSIPLESGIADAVTCQFGLMFFPDRPAALREFFRVLKPGGTLAVTVWDSLENTPIYAKVVALLQRMAGEEAANALRIPYGLGDPDRLGGLLRDAGFVEVVADRRRGTGRFESVRQMVQADLYGWLPVMGIELSEGLCESILAAAEVELSEFVQADGSVLFDSSALIVSAGKPTERADGGPRPNQGSRP